MKTCIDFKIPLCYLCKNNIDPQYCWIVYYWPNYFTYHNINDIKFLLAKYNALILPPTNNDGYDRQIYFLKFLEIFHKNQYDQLTKLLVLQ
jgi:hypothetical protein